MKNPPTTVKQSSSKTLFFCFLALFVLSACACAFVMKLDRSIERTSGKVIESYSKKTFVSRKKSYEQEYAVVGYSIAGKEHTGKTLRRTVSDMVPVYYYSAFPAMAWFYKKENPHLAYCCIVMTLSLLGVILTRPKSHKNPPGGTVKTQQKNK
jgi:hypothetical protein